MAAACCYHLSMDHSLLCGRLLTGLTAHAMPALRHLALITDVITIEKGLVRVFVVSCYNLSSRLWHSS